MYVHYIEQKDCSAGLDAGGISEIPQTKLNQVDASYTGRTACTGEGPSIGVLTLWLQQHILLSHGCRVGASFTIPNI